MYKRIISSILLISMLTTMIVLTSCSDDVKDPNSNPVVDSNVTDESTKVEETVKRPNLPNVTYDNYDFKILTREFAGADPWPTYEASPVEENGEILNDSIYASRMVIEDRYDITITQVNHAEPITYAKQNIMAEDNTFDVMMSSLFDCTTLAQENMAVNLNAVDHIDLSNDWWDQSSIRDLSIGDKQYFVTGDFSYRNYNASWIYAFNKNMITNFQLDDPYELVTTGKWTIDKFAEMVTDVSADVDGNGKMDDKDRYGIIIESSNTLGMFIGAENFVISKDEENYPKITINTERGIATLDKLFKFMNDRSIATSSDEPYYSSYSDVWSGLVSVFTDDRGLFYAMVMYTVKKLRNMDSDFGLLPMPKYDEAQEKYYTWTSPWIASGLAMPITNSDTSRSGVILEDLTYEFSNSVRLAYYDITLAGKFARDTESEAMVDIILDNRVYDLGMIYDWGGVGTLLNTMTSQKADNFTSRYEALAVKAQTALEKTIEAYKELE